jgi:hypothetical protein
MDSVNMMGFPNDQSSDEGAIEEEVTWKPAKSSGNPSYDRALKRLNAFSQEAREVAVGGGLKKQKGLDSRNRSDINMILKDRETKVPKLAEFYNTTEKVVNEALDYLEIIRSI